MAVFRFKLQKVLDVKLSFEELAKRDFGQAQRQLIAERNQMAEFVEAAAEFKLEMAERRKRGSTVREFQNDINRDWTNRRNIRDQRFKVSKAEGVLENKRQELIQAIKDRKIMEKLREKHFRQFQEEVKKEEMKFADEIAGRRSFFTSDMISGD